MPRNQIKKSESYTSEIGITGLQQFGGIIAEEELPELDNLIKANKYYKEMCENCPVIGAINFATNMYIRKVKWYVKPGAENSKALKKYNFLEECLKDFDGQNFNDIISEALSMLNFGWSIAEKVYRIRDKKNGSKYDDRKLGWKRWGFRSQETLDHWLYDENNILIGFEQFDPISGKRYQIPIKKCIHFRTLIRKDNPQGRSIFRNAVIPFYFKKMLEKMEAIGLEHAAVGVVCGWLPTNIITDESSTRLKSSFGDAIKKIQTGKGGSILLPLEYDSNGHKKYDLTILKSESNSSKSSEMEAVISRYETRIAQSVMYEVMMVGTGKTGGSYALSENKSSNFVQALGTFLEIIRTVINENAVNELFRINGDDMIDLPTIEYMPIAKADLKEIGQYLKDLSSSGAIIWPNRALQKFIMEIANMPQQTEEEIEESLSSEPSTNILDDNSNDQNIDNSDENNIDDDQFIEDNPVEDTSDKNEPIKNTEDMKGKKSTGEPVKE